MYTAWRGALGDPSVDADAEMISMVISCLKAAGLKEFQLSIGHADFFRGLMEAAGLLEEQEEELRELISNKNFFGVEEFVETLNLRGELKESLWHARESLHGFG